MQVDKMENQKSPGRKQPRTESYDQKLEQRAAKFESLRDRNATTCRSWGPTLEVGRRNAWQRKRQVEFHRRRHMGQCQVQSDGPSGEDRESLKDSKVTLRTTRHRGAPVERQPFISADELGIVWPDVHSPGTAPWISPPRSCPSVDEAVRAEHEVTSETPPLPHEASLSSGLEARDTDQADPPNHQTQPRSPRCQTEYGYVTVKEKDLLQLAEYLKEALWREDTLKQKLALLQRGTSTLLLSHDHVWKVGVPYSCVCHQPKHPGSGEG
ncbi:TRAF3-interacting JNK-activating modulator-like isoform X2 [Osmerus mordax]|uniref:TRAF3-interacting JNK-activating modulator-like isoform X2 n=1 Tax=Osmerus mordax TaxID=8014 RepID=UPI00350F9DE8